MNTIRLTEKHISAIQEVFRLHFMESDHLWIFGSRIDLNKKGGDIDLYVETNISDQSCLVRTRIKFLTALQSLIGEQKIDLVIKGNSVHLPIYDIAKTTGIQLV